MILRVTQADIDQSRERRTASTLDRQKPTYQSERDCPIGIALFRMFEHVKITERGRMPIEDRALSVRAHPDYLSVTFARSEHIPIVDSDGSARGSVYDHPVSMYRATQTIRAYMRDWDRYGRAQPRSFALFPY